MKVITQNRKAFYDYIVQETVEAGLVLTGTEIKSIRTGEVDLRQAFARPEDGELWLLGSHIAPYQGGNRYNHDPGRPRKLLLHRKEIRELTSQVREKGFTLVPLKLYLKHGLAKVELAVAKGRKAYDRRDYIAQRDAQREAKRLGKAWK